jgi:hypothetical protein
MMGAIIGLFVFVRGHVVQLQTYEDQTVAQAMNQQAKELCYEDKVWLSHEHPERKSLTWCVKIGEREVK